MRGQGHNGECTEGIDGFVSDVCQGRYRTWIHTFHAICNFYVVVAHSYISHSMRRLQMLWALVVTVLCGMWSTQSEITRPDLVGGAHALSQNFQVLGRAVIALVFATATYGTWSLLQAFFTSAPQPPLCMSPLLERLHEFPCTGFIIPGVGYCFVSDEGGTRELHEYYNARILYEAPPYFLLSEQRGSSPPFLSKRPRDVTIAYTERGQRVTTRLRDMAAVCMSFWATPVQRFEL